MLRVHSLMVQMVKNPPAMQETQVQTLVGKIPWRRKWQSTPVLLPGESHRQRRLLGYSPRGPKKGGMTEQLTLFTFTWTVHSMASEKCMRTL